MKRLARGFAAIAVTVCALLGTMIPVRAQATQPQHLPLEEETDLKSGITTYPFNPEDLPGALLKTVSGHRDISGTCHFEISGSADATEVISTQEVEFNSTNCTLQIAEARYDASSPEASALTDIPDSARNFQVNPTATRPLRTVIVVKCLDPVSIKVNSVTSGQIWTNSGVRSHINETYMLEASGWRRASFSKFNQQRTTMTSASFVNHSFCIPKPTTHVAYANIRLTTRPNGKYDYSYSSSKSGGCSFMLSQRVNIYSWYV